MKVFLSSTYEDLLEYRVAAASAIERLGQQAIRMENFGARPNDAREVCFREIEEADAIVAIYSHRYGYIPKGQDKSLRNWNMNLPDSK